MTPIDVIREMREMADAEGLNEMDILRWAGALEQAMREPVAEVYESADSVCGERGTEIDWIGSRRCDPGTKLYCLPPDAEEEIERLQESCRRREDRATEASHQASVLANVCADQKKEIERLREAVAWHERRWAELQKQQAQMRDPERKMVCDILANGKTYERAALANKEDKDVNKWASDRVELLVPMTGTDGAFVDYSGKESAP